MMITERKSIIFFEYNSLVEISYYNEAYTENVYSPTGEKLRMTHGTSLNAATAGTELYGDVDFTEQSDSEVMAAAASATSVTEYHGNVIYRDGKPDMVLFPGGYATINGTAVTFHYYTRDYFGNNRGVINGSTGAIGQTTAYYHYGGIIPDLGNPYGGQPYRFVYSKRVPISRLGPVLSTILILRSSIVFLNEQKSIFFMIFKHFRLQNCFKLVTF